MNNSLERLSRDISRDIESHIEHSGIMYRIFNRAKSTESIEKKMKIKNYQKSGKLMQDSIGVRITLYFNDDIEVLYNFLKTHPDYKDETLDINDESSFKPQRLNLIFNMKPNYADELVDKLDSISSYIDKTFEIQIRTMFSEGWHEVEHDLRYKNQQDWESHQDLSRVLNGIYATLETQDWSIISIFDQLAHKHYKDSNWNAMLRSKLRIRFINNSLSNDIIKVFDENIDVAKEFYRVNRKKLLKKIIDEKLKIPLTLDNVVFLINIFFIKNTKIDTLIPITLRQNEKLFPNAN